MQVSKNLHKSSPRKTLVLLESKCHILCPVSTGLISRTSMGIWGKTQSDYKDLQSMSMNSKFRLPKPTVFLICSRHNQDQSLWLMPCGFISGVCREKHVTVHLHQKHVPCFTGDIKLCSDFLCVCFLFSQNHGHKTLLERANSIEILLLQTYFNFCEIHSVIYA